jgi:hypothetical protein
LLDDLNSVEAFKRNARSTAKLSEKKFRETTAPGIVESLLTIRRLAAVAREVLRDAMHATIVADDLSCPLCKRSARGSIGLWDHLRSCHATYQLVTEANKAMQVELSAIVNLGRSSTATMLTCADHFDRTYLGEADVRRVAAVVKNRLAMAKKSRNWDHKCPHTWDCGLCNRGFGSEQGLRDHTRAKHGEAGRS